MTEIPVTNVGTPQCPGCLATPQDGFIRAGDFKLLQCPQCNDTFVVILESSLFTTLKVDVKPPEPPPE